MKPYAESCDQNRHVILEAIKPLLLNKKQVLEIGSGTGQHAVFFAKAMPHLIWHTSDQSENHHGIQQWLTEANLTNTRPPIALDVSRDTWPQLRIDVIFAANAVHIMSWNNVIDLFYQAGKLLKKEGVLILYGPFNYNNNYTSNSNARFDQWLKHRDPNSGIRDFDALDILAKKAGFIFNQDIQMPANNRILEWLKK